MNKFIKLWKKKLHRRLYRMLTSLGFRPFEIYTLTTLSFDDSKLESGSFGEFAHSKRSRCWGWHATREDAIKSATMSADFYSECGYYTHIVIESNTRGWGYDHNPTWIELRKLSDPREHKHFDSEAEGGFYVFKIEYEAVIVDRPRGTKQIVGWGIG